MTELRALVGEELPSGEVTVSRRDAFLWADATRNPDDAFRYDDDAREVGAAGQLVAPVLPQHVVNEGAVKAEEALAEADLDWESGVYLGEQSFEYHGELRVGETYAVTGEISDVTRKEGSSGGFQVVTLSYAIHGTGDREGELLVETDKRIVVMEDQ